MYTAEADAAHLLRLAEGTEADLIVTGAYGHSRLGEWMFGGMTRLTHVREALKRLHSDKQSG